MQSESRQGALLIQPASAPLRCRSHSVEYMKGWLPWQRQLQPRKDADGHSHPRMWVALPSSRSVRDGRCPWPPTGSRGLLPTVRSRKPPGQTYNPAGLSPVALQVLGRLANGLHRLGLTARPGTTTDTPHLPPGAPSGRGTLFGGGGSRSRKTQVKPHPPTRSGGTASPGSSQATGNGALRSRSEPQLPILDHTRASMRG